MRTHTLAYIHTLVQTYRRRLQEQIFIVYPARGEKQKMTVEEKQREAERRRESINTGCLLDLAVSLVRGKGKRLNEKKRKIQEQEKALLVFLEELRERERTTAIRQVMEKKEEGQPEDRGMQDRKREEMKMGKHLPGNTFARLFWCIFHMSRGMKRAKDDRGKRRRKSGGAERNEHLYCINAHVGMQSQTDW